MPLNVSLLREVLYVAAVGTIACIQQENLQITHTVCEEETIEWRGRRLIIPIKRIHIFLCFVPSYRSKFE